MPPSADATLPVHARPLSGVLLTAALWLLAAVACAGMLALEETDMAQVSGAGIAIGLDDFQYAMAPTSYFEQFGSTPTNNCTATGNVAANQNCWRRGDLRWFGINISDASLAGYHWNDTTACTPSALNDCPRGGVIDWFSPFDNPYIIRAWSPQGMHYDGGCINGDDGAGGCNAATSNTTKAIYEFLAPTARNGANTGPGQPDYIFSFWGEIEAGTTRNSQTQSLATGTAAAGYGRLKSQTIIRGNAAGSIFRLFQFPQAGNQTFAMFYHSYLRGDFRFSVNQGATAVDGIGLAPVFAATEGLTFRNVNAFLPFGQLYYQALTLGAVGTGGNFYLELTPIPNNATVYTEYYGAAAGDTRGYETARTATPGNTAGVANGGTATADYRISHGFSRWGGWYPGLTAGRNAQNATDDGIIFRSCTTCGTFYAFADKPIRIDKRGETAGMHQTQNYTCATGNTGAGCTQAAGPIVSGPGDATRTYPVTAGNGVNLGDGRLEGLLINRLRIESCPKTGAC